MKKLLFGLSGIFVLCCSFFLYSSYKPTFKPEQFNAMANNPELFHQCSEQLTNVIVYDIFKPPVASRIYSCSYLAAYEAIRQENASYPTMAGRINQFRAVPLPEKDTQYCFALAGMVAFNRVGEELTFSKDLWDNFNKGFYDKFKLMGIPDAVYQRSVEYGEAVAKHVLAYAQTDHYNQTRRIKFSVVNKPGSWVPTPPTYADACEPAWNTIRHFLIDSASQFKPVPSRNMIWTTEVNIINYSKRYMILINI